MNWLDILTQMYGSPGMGPLAGGRGGPHSDFGQGVPVEMGSGVLGQMQQGWPGSSHSKSSPSVVPWEVWDALQQSQAGASMIEQNMLSGRTPFMYPNVGGLSRPKGT